ncbi:aldo/keto reductase [Streptomyces sp. NPDC058284]|uniref:aldo/keto reductase n=1 Tax=unclassified Streptomyces TaxID=2593676 RepID=UPI00364E7446
MTSSTECPRFLAPGLTAQPLAVGCRAIGGLSVQDGVPVRCSTSSDDVALEGLRTAVSTGANLFDTADSFGLGHSERLLGRLVAEVGRSSVLLSSKAGQVRGTAPHPYAGPSLRHRLEQTLDNLDTEYVDLYSLHTLDFGREDRYLHVAIEQLRAFRDVGCVRAIGMPGPPSPEGAGGPGNAAVSDRQARFRQIFGLLRPDVLWTSCSPLAEPPHVAGEPLAAFAARHGIALLLTEPLAQGLITGKYTPKCRPRFAPGDQRRSSPLFGTSALRVIDEELAALRARFGPGPDDMARVALGFALQQGDHTVVAAGFSSPCQVAVNHSLGPILTAQEMACVAGAYGRIRRRLHEVIHGQGRRRLPSGDALQGHGVKDIPPVGSGRAP